jgi:hypothetical protein
VSPERGPLTVIVSQDPMSAFTEQLMEEVCDRENLERAWKRVKRNKGSPGVPSTDVADRRLAAGTFDRKLARARRSPVTMSFGFAGQAGQLLLPQIEERRDDGRGLFLAHLHPRCGILRVQPLDVKRPMA